MSLLKNSKYTISANIINQLFGMFIFLIVPNILSHGDYAQTVYISVLMSFIILSDFGMSFVYGRIMPAIYKNNDIDEIEQYNQTFFWFGLIMSILGSIVISIIYYVKYENIFNSLIIIFINPLSVIIGFFVHQYSVREDFKVYRNINIKNSIFRLIVIPLTYLFGVGGWLSTQVISSILVLKTIKSNIILKHDKFDFLLIKNHFLEAILLMGNFFFWNQLLNSGRLFSIGYFDDKIIAQYGITNAGYTLLLSFSISIFLPVTVASLKIMQKDTKNAIEQLFSIIIKVSIPLFLLVIFAVEVAPYLYKIFFSKYDINFDILKYQLFSLIALPFYATLGNVFIGTKQPIKLIFINCIAFFVAFISFKLLVEKNEEVSAAIAQCIGINFLGVVLLFATFVFYGEFIENKLKKLSTLLFVIYTPYIVYITIRSLI